MIALTVVISREIARGLALAALMLAALFGSAVSVSAQDLPARPDGAVYDGADILSASTEAELDRTLRAYNEQTGRALIVATIPSLDGEPIEPYATRLFSTWGIGGAERDMGLLLLVARDDREMRIEIGYGLHPYFGGIMASRIIRDTITPRFRNGDFDGGVTQGIAAIMAHLENSPEDAIAIAEAAEAAEAQSNRSDGGLPFGVLIWFGFIFLFFILPILRAKGRRRYRSKGEGPWGKRGRDFGDTASDIILWEIGSAIARGAMSGGSSSGSSWGGGGSSFGGGGGFGGFGGGMSGGGGASGGW